MAAPLVQRALDLRARGEFAEAERVLRAALVDHPRDAIVATNLAVALLEREAPDAAVELLQRAIEIDSRCAAAHFNYANVLRASGRLAEAIEHYSAAIRGDPEFTAAPEELMHALLEACDWSRAAGIAQDLRDRAAREPVEKWMRFISPMTAVYLGLDAVTCKQVAAFHANRSLPRAKIASRFAARTSAGAGEGRTRISVAYFSRDFRDHAVGRILRRVLALHDRARFEIAAYSFGPDDGSAYRRDIVSSVDRFIDISTLSDDEAAAAIKEARVDVLIDLMGHTTGNRLGVLARRPAPIQAHYLGYAATTGADYIDFFVSDAMATPPEMAPQFTEQISRVPDCFMVTDGADALAAVPSSRAAQALSESAYVFANFNNPSRITSATFELWMQVLKAIPDSILWLRRAHEVAMQNLRREAQAQGVDPARLLFAQRTKEKSEHLGRLALADLALDTLDWYNGHSSTADMLWAGVPVLTCPGQTFASRVAASLVRAAGSPELVAPSHEAYVDAAVRIARDRTQSRELHAQQLEARKSAPFFDTPRLVRGLEAAYEAMYAAERSAGV
ncbi:MAG: O-linked N-acetylglucosamine transferase, SPINDLY family protein [Burkholderiales bacterium]